MNRKIKTIILTAFLTIFFSLPVYAESCNTIASTDEKTEYTYEEMVSDIKYLTETYPMFVSSRVIGQSVLGRDIFAVVLGNEAAPKKVCIQASIHAREYIVSQLAIRLIEDYADAYSKGEKLDILESTCYYIVPMVNPDGVSIAQYGASSTTNEATATFIKSQPSTTMWKSNANGVDLNRCWNVNWEGMDSKGHFAPSFEMWKGPAPETEPEVKALKAFTQSQNFNCFVNFHMQGQVLYSGSELASREINDASANLARSISKLNGYTPILLEDDGKPHGGTFGDYVCVNLKKPSVTIEFGNALGKAYQSQFGNMYKKHSELLTVISNSI